MKKNKEQKKMSNTHELLEGVKGILVKDFKPKYKTVELIECKEMYPLQLLFLFLLVEWMIWNIRKKNLNLPEEQERQ